MESPLSAPQILDRHYLEMRCSLLDLAAAFDRIERAGSSSTARQDARYQLLRQAIDILADSGTDRAARLQMLFSDEYVAGWNQS